MQTSYSIIVEKCIAICKAKTTTSRPQALIALLGYLYKQIDLHNLHISVDKCCQYNHTVFRLSTNDDYVDVERTIDNQSYGLPMRHVQQNKIVQSSDEVTTIGPSMESTFLAEIEE